MSSNVKSIDSTKTLILTASGIFYLYFALSLQCLASGLPLLTGLFLHWSIDTQYSTAYPRIVIGAFVSLHLAYWICVSSYILFPLYAISIWTSIIVVAFTRYDFLYQRLAPIRPFFAARIASFEKTIRELNLPILDFDGQGILALTGSSLTLSQMTFAISGIDFSLQVDENTKIIAKVEGLCIRLARDITVQVAYLKLEGDGTPASDFKSFNPVSRTPTASTISSRKSLDSEETASSIGTSSGKSPLRRVPPPLSETPPRAIPISDSKAPPTQPPKLPPRLPPRKPSSVPSEASADNYEDETELEKDEMRRAIEASLNHENGASDMSDSSVPHAYSKDHQISVVNESVAQDDTLHKGPDVRTTSTERESTTAFFYPESEDTDTAEIKAAFDEAAIHHSSSTTHPANDEFDIKAAVAASLEDQTALHKQRLKENRVQLSEVLAKIPWWLKITPGPLVTRLLLSPLIWLHPITVCSVAATGTGKRITNLMETSGLKKAHPNQEIFKLIRKVFVWLEAGDISIVLNDIAIRPHIPLAADHDVRIDVTAQQPTAYRNTGGTDDVLAKIHAISATLHIPTFLLPNHEYLIPKSVRSSIPISMLFSLPGVFNRELLTIGAAFVKATTMMDLRQTAQSRAPPPMPSLSGGGQFSFRSLGQAVKQAAGDLAKQKGVQWGVRDAELAKWTAKLARLMAYIKLDVGGKGEIPVDLIKLRRKVVAREQKQL